MVQRTMAPLLRTISQMTENPYTVRRSTRTEWRISTLLSMGATLVLLSVSTFSTGWRVDIDARYEVIFICIIIFLE